MKMDKLTTKRVMTLQSRIPVPVRKPKPSNLTFKKSESSEKQTSVPRTSNCNKLGKNSQCLSKQLVYKSKPQENKIGSSNTCKENKKCSTVSQTSNSDKTDSKNSNIKVKDVRNRTGSQVKVDPLFKSYTKNKISENTPFVSQTTNIDKTIASNFHSKKKENIKESCHQPVKFVNAKNVTNSKNKFASSKENIQPAGKISLNTKLVKKETSEKNQKKEHIKESCYQPVKFVNAKNVTNLKNKTSETSSEKNQETNEESCFPDQKDIKFEANEFCRNMILSGKGLSPSIFKIMPGIRVSSVRAERPSVYQKFEVCANPFQDALQAIADFSAKRASRNMSISGVSKNMSIQKDKKMQSVFEGRDSFYTPCANPKEEVMKSLERLKARRLQRSALKNLKKKVTFNLQVEEYTAKVDSDSESLPPKNIEAKLTQISERSEETTPISPVKAENVNPETNEHQSDYQELCVQINAAILTDSTKEPTHSSVRKGFETCTSPAKSTITAREVRTNTCVLPVEPALCKETSSTISPPVLTYGHIKLTEEDLNSHRTSGILSERNTNGQRVKKSSQAKLYTPRPVSFYSNSRHLNDIPSPEFLAGKTIFPNLAPIYTPLALKNIAKSSAVSPDADLSPVRVKLDFATTENDSPLKENFVRRLTLNNLQNIVTVQKKLDELADRECSFWLPESIPVVCGRHLQNPIAVTLSEGDEMHFLPI